MTDYAYSQTLIRLADNPEIDPPQDKVYLISTQTEAAGYAREDNRWVVAAGDTVDIDLDAFQDCDWVDLAVQNEGANQADLTLTDDLGVEFTLPIPAGAYMLLRAYKVIPKPGDAPAYLYSAGGTKVRIFAWGPNWTGEPQ
jgi:hypothetical protein